MPDSSLEALRSQIREAEERLKHSAVSNSKTKTSRAAAENSKADEVSTLTASATEARLASPAQGNDRQRTLQRSFGAALEACPESVILVDAEGGWELANHHLPDWLGYSREEFQGINLSQILEAEDAKNLLASFPQWLGGRKPLIQVPYNLRSKKGDPIPVLLSSHSSFNEQGEAIAYLIMEDTRPRRSLEAQIAATKAFIDAVMRGGTVPILLLRRDGAIIDVNDAAGRWLGLTTENLLNTRLRDHVAAATRTEFDAVLARVLASQPATNFHCRFLRNSGAEFGSRISLVGVFDPKGVVSRVLCTTDRFEFDGPNIEKSGDWTAYGQMTPGVLKELSHFISGTMHDIADQMRADTAAEPGVPRLLRSIDTIRSALAAWADSAEFLSAPPGDRCLGNLLRDAVASRRSELERWGIDTVVQIADSDTEQYLCPPALFPAVLHIIQSCSEEIREYGNAGRLTIQVQTLGERLEITFLYELPTKPAAFSADGATETLRFKNVELRAAQKLLDSLGGTLVLENITETQHTIRMKLNRLSFAGSAAQIPTEKQG